MTKGAAGAALVLAFVLAAPAHAQSGTKTLGGDKPAKGGTMMTRDELRSCLKEQQAQAAQVAELERRRAEIAAEADAVRQQKDAVQVERDAFAAMATEVQAFKEKVKSHGERVALYNERAKAFKENPPRGADAEREHGQLEAEGAAVSQADAAIKAEAAQWTAKVEPARAALTEHTQAQQAAANAAIEHNRVFNEAVKVQEDQLAAWKQRCGNRPYRESDEKAIRAEK
jgi:predicted  nucleic acid-binding Zn-ribbon protein